MPSMDFKTLHKELKRQGWRVEKLASGHFRAFPPDPTRSMVHFSESNDPRAIRNIIRDLGVKGGFQWWELDTGGPKSSRRLEAAPTLTEDAPSSGLPPTAQRVLEALMEGNVEPPPSQSNPEPAPSFPKTVDELFAELRDARAFLDLANEELARREQAARDAQAALTQAKEERARAAEAMRSLKREFDAAFAVDIDTDAA